MHRILATALIALSAAVGLPGAAHAGGPTSVLITQQGEAAAALYYDDAAYDALLGLLPATDTQGKPQPPGGGGDYYSLTWMIHDVSPWRFDRVHVARDGTAWVSTSLSADSGAGWQPLASPENLVELLTRVLDRSASPQVVTLAGEVAQPTSAPATPDEPDASWFSLTGWRWVVPGALLGLLVGAVAARRRDEEGPRQVLLTSES